MTGLFLPHFYRVKTKPFEHCDFVFTAVQSLIIDPPKTIAGTA